MKKILFVIIALLPVSVQAAEVQKKMTLKECYEQALHYSDVIQISDQSIQEAKTRYMQALGQVLPQISVQASEFLQDDSANTSNTNTTGQVVNTFTRFSRPQVGLNATQNLFQGFKELAAIKMSRMDQARQRYNKDDAERLLYKDVAVAFFTVEQIEKSIVITERLLKVYHSQIEELNQRIKLGKSRESEVLAQQSDMSLLEANLAAKKGELKVAYEMLSFLTGLSPQPPIRWIDPTELKLNPEKEYLAIGQERPDIKASEQAAMLAKENITVQRSTILPAATAQANFYPYRVGFQKDIHWDATFNMGIPLFNWSSYGLIREAKIQAKKSALELDQLRRQSVTEIKKAYDKYQSSVDEYKKYTVAAKIAEKSYLKQREDFSLGLITNLDVLRAQNTWLLALQSQNTSQVQVLSDWISLQITAGIKPQ